MQSDGQNMRWFGWVHDEAKQTKTPIALVSAKFSKKVSEVSKFTGASHEHVQKVLLELHNKASAIQEEDCSTGCNLGRHLSEEKGMVPIKSVHMVHSLG